jgi:hypothetical protein
MGKDDISAARALFAFHIADGLRAPVDDDILGDGGRPAFILETVCTKHKVTILFCCHNTTPAAFSAKRRKVLDRFRWLKSGTALAIVMASW